MGGSNVDAYSRGGEDGIPPACDRAVVPSSVYSCKVASSLGLLISSIVDREGSIV